MKELSEEDVQSVSGGNCDFGRLEIYAGTYLDPRTNPAYWE